MSTFTPAVNGPETHGMIVQPSGPGGSSALFTLNTATRRVYRLALQSGLLQNLTLGALSLTPAFSPSILHYSAPSASLESIVLSAVAATCGSSISIATSEIAVSDPAALTYQLSSSSSQTISLSWSLTYVYLRVVSPDLLHTVFYIIAVGTAPSVPGVPSSLASSQSLTLNVVSGFTVVVMHSAVPANQTMKLLQITPLVAPIGSTIMEVTVSDGSVSPSRLVFTSIPSAVAPALPTMTVSFTAPSVGGSVDFSFTLVSSNSLAPQYLAPEPVSISVETSFLPPATRHPMYSDSRLVFSLTMPAPSTLSLVTSGATSTTSGVARSTGCSFMTDVTAITPGVVQRVTAFINSCAADSTVEFAIWEFTGALYKVFRVPPKPGRLTSVRLPVSLPTSGLSTFDLTPYNLVIGVGQTLSISPSCTLDASSSSTSGTSYYVLNSCISYNPATACAPTTTTRMDNYIWSYLPFLPSAIVYGRSHPAYQGAAAVVAQYRTSVRTRTQARCPSITPVFGVEWRRKSASHR
jgi:hypothetical protein